MYKIRDIKLAHFKLPREANRVKLVKVENGLNRFLYRGTIINKFPFVITTKDIQRGNLKYEINGSEVHLKAIIQEYRNKGWKYCGVDGDSAIFTKDGYPDMKQYIGDISPNKIYFQYATDGSLYFGKELSCIEFFLDGTKVENKNSLYVNKIVSGSDTVTIDFKALFSDVISIDVSKYQNRYWMPSEPLNELSGKTVTFRYNPISDEVQRIIDCEEEQGYKFVIEYKGKLYFRNDKYKIKVKSLPGGPDSKLVFKVSVDGIRFSNIDSIIRIKKEYDDIDIDRLLLSREDEVPECKSNRTLIINRDNMVLTPSCPGERIKIIYE